MSNERNNAWLKSYQSNRELIHVKEPSYHSDLLLVNNVKPTEKYLAIPVGMFNNLRYGVAEYTRCILFKI